MSFGLCNAPAIFERLMETVVTGLQWDIYLIYLDDVIVFGKSFEDMLKNLFAVFERMHTAGLKLKARTCKRFSTEVEYLGHVVSKHGFATDPKKIDAVKTCLKPSNVSELRSFLGFCGYYRRYIAIFQKLPDLCTNLLKRERCLAGQWTAKMHLKD
jgi:DNA-binding LytR/AlgR family response regulator